MSFFHPASTGDDLSSRGPEARRELATELRAYWANWRDVTTEERWYRVLADDKETHESWLAAAGGITQPTAVTVVPGSMAFTTTYTSTGSGPFGLRGESLRAKSSPTVTELLVRRTADVSSDANASSQDLHEAGTLSTGPRRSATPRCPPSARGFTASAEPAARA